MEKGFWQAASRLSIVILAIIALFVTVYLVLPLIYPFLIGLILALLFNPFVGLLSRKAKFPRALAVVFTILLFFILLAGLITLAAIETASEVQNLQENMQENMDIYIEQVETFIMVDLLSFYDRFITFYSALDSEVQRNIENHVETASNDFMLLINAGITGLLDGLLSFIQAVPMMAAAIVISLLASFFISKDWPRWQQRFKSIIPERLHKSGGSVLKDLRHALVGFIRAQLTLITITFIIVLTGLMVLQIEYALSIALFVAIIDLLPYLGTGLIFIPWIIYSFVIADYFMAISLSTLYAIVVVQRQMMEPKILGDNVGLEPLTTLIALFVGFKLFGFIGLIIGPVIMVMLAALNRAGVFKEIWAFVKKGA